MPEFTVPQFIEREPKIVGPFNWKQFIFVGIAGMISFVLYFSIPFPYFVLITILLMLGALALAFLKIGGRPIPAVIAHFFFFFISPKIYIWGRKISPPKIIEKVKPKPEEIKEAPVLKIAEKSHLEKLATKIKTMTR